MDIFVIALVFLTILFIISFRHTTFFKQDVSSINFDYILDRGNKSIKNAFLTMDGAAVIGTLIILLSSLYVILSGNYDAGTKNWAFGMIGAISGFWLRNPR